MKPRLLLADDDVSSRQMLAYVLKQMRGYEIAGEAANGEEALQLCQAVRPSVLVADLRMPVMGGVALAREVRKLHLEVAVLFYSGAMDDESILAALEAEPEGFVLKSDDLTTLREAVKAVCAGRTFWGPRAAELRALRMSKLSPLSALTASEREVLKLLVSGKSTKEIASALDKSKNTVAHQRQSMMDKLGVHHAIGLVEIARKAGFW